MASFIEQNFQRQCTVPDTQSQTFSEDSKSTGLGRNHVSAASHVTVTQPRSAPNGSHKLKSTSHAPLKHQAMVDLSKIITTCQERQVTLSKFKTAKDSCTEYWKDDATAQWRVADQRMKAAQEDLEHLWSQATDLEPSETQCLTNISDMLVLKDKRWTPQLVERVLQGKPAWLDTNMV